MTLDAAYGRSKVDSTHDFPATLERHGRSFRHISPWLTVEEFTCEGATLFRRRETGQASRQPSRQESFRVDTCERRRDNGRLDQSRFFCFRSKAWVFGRSLTRIVGSIPDGVTGIFHPGRTMALGSTQPLTEMSTRNLSWG
jgi:hypothetical protein